MAVQEEERERRMDYVPDESAVSTELIEVRKVSKQEAPLLGGCYSFLGCNCYHRGFMGSFLAVEQ